MVAFALDMEDEPRAKRLRIRCICGPGGEMHEVAALREKTVHGAANRCLECGRKWPTNPNPRSKPPIQTPSRDPLSATPLGRQFDVWLSRLHCAPTMLLAHRDHAHYLVQYFGHRPLEDFAGEAGAELVKQYILDESGGRDRGLRERFGGKGNLARALSYTTIRQRVNSLRNMLEDAVLSGALTKMATPWPIPPAGSHGQAARARFLLKPELEKALEREPRKCRVPMATTSCETPIGSLASGGQTLGQILDWHLKCGQRKATEATRIMHAQHVRRLKQFFGADRPVADFRGAAGYRLLMEYVEKEGPDDGGRGMKFVSIRKFLNTLAMALRESVKRGDLESLPPWPELPCDSEPRERYLSFDEYKKIRALLVPHRRLWLDLGVWTGQHSSDISSMTWEMVDLGAGPGSGPGPGPAFWLRRNTKNKRKPAWLPMPDELRASLTEVYDQNPPTDPKQAIVGRWHNVRTGLRRACRKLGIPSVAPIDLRRTCATWWIEKGGPKDALRRWLGHAQNSAMVDRHYSQITPDMVDGGVQALNRAARDPGSAGPACPPQGPRLLRAVAVEERRL
jgi:integrase